MNINLHRAKYSASEILEALIIAQHAEKPLHKALRIEDAENHFQDLARELGFAVFPLVEQGMKEAAE